MPCLFFFIARKSVAPYSGLSPQHINEQPKPSICTMIHLLHNTGSFTNTSHFIFLFTHCNKADDKKHLNNRKYTIMSGMTIICFPHLSKSHHLNRHLWCEKDCMRVGPCFAYTNVFLMNCETNSSKTGFSIVSGNRIPVIS